MVINDKELKEIQRFNQKKANFKKSTSSLSQNNKDHETKKMKKDEKKETDAKMKKGNENMFKKQTK